MFGDIPSLSSLETCIHNPSLPIGMRMRAAYFLRHIHTTEKGSPAVVKLLADGLRNGEHGALLRHEFAYVMGQLRDEEVSRRSLIIPWYTMIPLTLAAMVAVLSSVGGDSQLCRRECNGSS